MKDQPTYIERAAVMKSESSVAEVKKINAVYKKFTVTTAGIAKNTVDMANLARELGIHLQTLCGHEQLKEDFWKDHCRDQIAFDFETAKMFVAVARKMPHKAKTVGEAVQFVQMALVAGGLLELPERTESQSRSTVSIVERFFKEFTLMRQPFKKIITERPMEQWDKPALGSFLSETQWVADERQKAEKLLNEA